MTLRFDWWVMLVFLTPSMSLVTDVWCDWSVWFPSMTLGCDWWMISMICSTPSMTLECDWWMIFMVCLTPPKFHDPWMWLMNDIHGLCDSLCPLNVTDEWYSWFAWLRPCPLKVTDEWYSWYVWLLSCPLNVTDEWYSLFVWHLPWPLDVTDEWYPWHKSCHLPFETYVTGLMGAVGILVQCIRLSLSILSVVLFTVEPVCHLLSNSWIWIRVLTWIINKFAFLV